MLPLAGSLVLAVALPAAVAATIAATLGAARGEARWVARGRRGSLAVATLLIVAVTLLLAGLLAGRFELRYVAEHSARDLPLYLKVSALWAGQEGSLLVWAAMQAALAAWVASHASASGPAESSDLVPWSTALLGMVTTFFTGLCMLGANPFIPLPAPPLDGAGLNPLLRHPAMALHPPLVYVGFVGLAAPAALALAALIVRDPDAFARPARPWALGSWLFLGAGLLLGARWAYDVLSWGGYWTWDPVENAGLLPWLTATGMLHALGSPREGRGTRRGALRGWGVTLAVISFLLVILGTFITRSGMIASVHAFARSRVGPPLLAFLGLAALGSLAVVLGRIRLLATPRGEGDGGEVDALLSREGLHVLTLVLLATLTASILIGTLLPTLTEALGATRRLVAGPEWFDRVTGPQFAGLVLLMGLCPLAGRATSSLRRVGGGAWYALAGGAILPALAAAMGVTAGLVLPAAALIGAAGGAIVAALARDVMELRRRSGLPVLAAVWRAARRHRRRYGGYRVGHHAVHVGVLIMAVGVVATRQQPFEASLVIPRGERATVQGYELAFEDLRQALASDHDSTHATVAVYRDGALRARLYPRLDRYSGSGQTISAPAVRATVREDLYVVLSGWEDRGMAATFHVIVSPLVGLIWAGGVVLLVGGAVALWPRRAVVVSDPSED